jgi:hypothetical protein
MAILNKAAILEADDILKETVAVPEWGGEVLVRGLTAAELDKYQVSMLQQRGKKQVANLENVRTKLVVLCVVDEDGKNLFDETDLKALSKKSGAAISRVFEVAQRLSGLGDEEIQEMTAELEADPLDGSPSV